MAVLQKNAQQLVKLLIASHSDFPQKVSTIDCSTSQSGIDKLACAWRYCGEAQISNHDAYQENLQILSQVRNESPISLYAINVFIVYTRCSNIPSLGSNEIRYPVYVLWYCHSHNWLVHISCDQFVFQHKHAIYNWWNTFLDHHNYLWCDDVCK